MAYSWQEQRLPAGSQTVPVEIQYLDRSYIHLYINEVEVTDFTWGSDTLIRFDQTLAEESTVLLVRRTPREYLYLMFSEGAAFIKENLDTQNRQFLHLAQELVEGRSVDGFFGNIDMNGYRIVNLRAGEQPGDAVNKGQLDAEALRISALENTFVSQTNSYPWYTTATEPTDILTPPLVFNKASVYINGVCQTPGYSYEVVANTIMLADPIPAGTHVFARLGEDVTDLVPDYATGSQLQAVAQRTTLVEEDMQTVQASMNSLQSDVTSLDTSKAAKGDAGLAQLGATAVGSAVFKAASQVDARAAIGANSSLSQQAQQTFRDAATGFTIKMGVLPASLTSPYTVTFDIPFTALFQVQLTGGPTTGESATGNAQVSALAASSFTCKAAAVAELQGCYWVAYGTS
ncbi:Non-contractile tail fiber protein [Escherichia phage vB_EcoP_PAS7]|uniref:Non-contractile tail fiber protein n=1 Tax=Escherichia phage vB_EcoP_PAS7 TaxID=3053875 RepID=A0AA51VIK7_9CAUD|nr:Non-contractile tail fiber protein [Escherichia phage vB_EcoP_PAS7]